jgi:hypothetical protein
LATRIQLAHSDMPPIPPPLFSSWTPRVVCYFQTHHKGLEYVSLLPLLTNPSGATHVILAAVHINADPSNLTLNDDAPSHPKYTQLWDEVVVLQDSGIKVLCMLGGAAKGSFVRLDYSESRTDLPLSRFEAYYTPLRDLIRLRNLDGIDLDVEEEMTLAGVIHLIDRLKSDFGSEFIITLAPVATALMRERPHLSGFNYKLLETARGHSIAWYNTQFYCGWGGIHNTNAYDEIIRNGWLPNKVVAGMLTNPKHAESGYVLLEWSAAVLSALVEKYPSFGCVSGWEFFDALPQEDNPWLWPFCMTLCMGMKKVRDAALVVSVGRSLAGITIHR